MSAPDSSFIQSVAPLAERGELRRLQVMRVERAGTSLYWSAKCAGIHQRTCTFCRMISRLLAQDARCPSHNSSSPRWMMGAAWKACCPKA